MYVYKVASMPSGQPGDEYDFWNHSFLQPLAPGVLTPLSLSVLSEVLGRVWFLYYDNLGFDPPYSAKAIRQHKGRPYLNLSQSAALESKCAGVQPMTLRVNDRDLPLAAWKKPGLFDGMRVSRKQRKLNDHFDRLDADIDQTIGRARDWYRRVSEMVWGQAELLQVMEQIERISLPSFETFFAARYRLAWSYNRLISLTQAQEPFPANLSLINNAVGDVDGLIENQMAEQMLAMASLVVDSPETLAWLKLDAADIRPAEVPHKAVGDALETFLADYGHRCADEGEMRNTRWLEDPTPVLKGILACTKETIKETGKQPVKMPAAQSRERLMSAVDAKQRKEAGRLIERIAGALRLQSKALNAVGYILAGTRLWALAAAEEAMNDKRLADADDIFFYELEEIKQMMTGEWNISEKDRIRSVAAGRRETYAQDQASRVPEIFFGDAAAESAVASTPGSSGQVTAPLRRWDTLQPHVCNGAVVGVKQLSSGWAIVLPVALGIITPTGTPMDPIAAAARTWHTPILMGLGEAYDGLVEGAQTTVDAEKLIIDQ